jgi:hypothetical protein
MNRIVAWVNKREQKRLEKLNKQHDLNFIFADSYDEFIEKLDTNAIPLILRRKANNYFKKLTDLVNKYPERIFYAYVEYNPPCTLQKEFCWVTHKNVKDCDEIDLWELFRSKMAREQIAVKN